MPLAGVAPAKVPLRGTGLMGVWYGMVWYGMGMGELN